MPSTIHIYIIYPRMNASMYHIRTIALFRLFCQLNKPLNGSFIIKLFYFSYIWKIEIEFNSSNIFNGTSFII